MNKQTFIDLFSKQIQAKNAIIFAGAGLSISAGFVDWKELVTPYAKTLNITPGQHAFPQIIQWYIDYQQNRRDVLQDIINKLCPPLATPTDNHKLLARLNIPTYWTTNYDHLLEKALELKGVKVIVDDAGLVFDRFGTSVNLYKMHGDDNALDNIVISQDDYDLYSQTHPMIYHALQTDLIKHTFLFLGYSFNDPNLIEIFRLIKTILKNKMRTHYCILKNDTSDNTQGYRIKDLKKYNIETILIEDFSEITEILNQLSLQSTTNSNNNSIIIADTNIFGRQDEEECIVNKLVHNTSVYIWGPAGVGKTIIAYKIYNKLYHNHFKMSIFYFFPAQSDDNFESILDFIAQRFTRNDLLSLKINEKHEEIKRLLSNNPGTFIFIDNVNDSSIIDCLFTLSPHCVLLITSRIDKIHPQIHTETLDILKRSESIELFCKSYGESISPETQPTINSICNLLGDLPGTIDMCGNYARVNKLSISTLYSQINSYPQLILGQFYEIIRMPFDKLNKEEKEYFMMLSLFNGREFKIDVLISMWCGGNAIMLLSKLRELSLVKTKDNSFYLHPSIHLFAKDEFEKLSNKKSYISRMIDYYLQFCEVHRNKFDSLEKELNNILTSMTLCYEQKDEEKLLKYCEYLIEMEDDNYNAYGFLPQKGYFNECIELVDNCLQLTNNRKTKARLNSHMGLINYWLGDNLKAMQHYNTASSDYDLDNDSYGQITILHKKGFIQSDIGQYNECLHTYLKSLDIAENKLHDQALIDTCIHLIGVIHYNTGNYAKSEIFLKQALERRSTSGKGLSVTQRRLAGTYRRLGKISEAKELLNSALKYDRLGNHRNIARTLRQLGMVHLEDKNKKEAQACFNESYKIFQNMGNKKGIASVLTNLGQINYENREFKEAIIKFNDSLKLAKELNAQYGIAINQSWLAKTYLSLAKYKAAIDYAVNAISIYQEIGFMCFQDTCTIINKCLRKLDGKKQFTQYIEPINNVFAATNDKYRELWQSSIDKLSNNNPDFDPYLQLNKEDPRRGISLIIRPSIGIIESITKIQEQLNLVIPNQYQYNKEDLHITISSLIIANELFKLSSIDTNAYREELNTIFQRHRPFLIHFKGISITNNCVLVKGYFAINTIDSLRNDIINVSEKLGINPSERYLNVSAHVTIFRFANDKDNFQLLLPVIDKFSSYDFGLEIISKIEFVENDWYMKKNNISLLGEYYLS